MTPRRGENVSSPSENGAKVAEISYKNFICQYLLRSFGQIFVKLNFMNGEFQLEWRMSRRFYILHRAMRPVERNLLRRWCGRHCRER